MGTIGLQKRLDALEEAFQRDLMLALRDASQNSGSQLFRSEEHNPHPELDGRTDAVTNRLLEQARTILQLRAKLAERPKQSLAAKFVGYCESYNDLSNPHRNGVRKHAEALLSEISLR